MRNRLKYVLIFVLFVTIDGSFHLYNTNDWDNRDYKDCLYSFTLNSNTKEWQLVPYCIRHNVSSTDGQCYGNVNYTFEQMNSLNIDSHHLYRWKAPIDTINNYQKYRTSDDFSLRSHRYCNCSADWFGTRCQYSLSQSDGATTFDEIITSQFTRKAALEEFHKIVNDPSVLTCYEGLQCHSTICLDWRQICDGSFNCENGEDEPEECFLLETNECEKDEHRCRSGMCIPKTFLIDFDVDCVDLSDEIETYRGWSTDDFCFRSPRLLCDFSLCNVNYFSCGDGQCVSLFSDKWHKLCNNGRDMFLRRNLLLSATSNDGNSSKTLTSQCWILLMCIFDTKNIDLFDDDEMRCECSWDSRYDRQCLESFRNVCPVSFIFQNEENVLYPFVRFVYHNRSNSSSEWWWPTHFCYNQSHCPAFPFTGFPLIDGLMCIEYKEIKDWLWLTLLFSACRIGDTSMLAEDKRFFYCDQSMKFISKHRIRDDHLDCAYEEDEHRSINTTLLNNLNLIYHFKCTQIDEWFPRPVIGDGQCLDNSDTLYIGSCKTASDLGCQFLRNLHRPHVDYVFQENCNGIPKLTFSDANETDETNCDEWSWPIYRRCDGYWDVDNGEDELNCSNTILSYITHTVLKCNVNEHYCHLRNRTMGCLAKEHAGDEIVDCVGKTDERRTSCARSNPLYPFECSNGKCVKLTALCDGNNDCPNGDDELICSWIDVDWCKYPDFNCNNLCFPRTSQCDGIIDCQPDGEDEWFCDLGSRKIPQFSLDKIQKSPPVIDSPDSMIDTVFYPPESLSSNILLKSESINSLKDWFCNRGMIVTKRSSNIECLCPPSYYGPRCQYQAERLLITVRIDTPTSLSGHQNQHNVIRVVACLMLDDSIVHHEQIVHEPLMKQMFYLNYPRPPPKQDGNWSVRLDAFSVTKFNVDLKGSWLFDVPFSFLPVNRLVLHLTLKDQQTCDTRICLHGSCRKYLNSPHREYCQCEENWSGRYCNFTNICFCAEGGKCVDRYPTPICVCPLGRMGSECQVLFDPCNDVNCEHDGTCLPLDERQSTKLFTCSCRSGYYGSRCEHGDARIDIHFSDSLFVQHRPLSAAVFVHFLELKNDSPGILFVQNRLLHKQVRLNKPLRVFNSNQKYLSSFILLQIFFETDNSGFYIAAIIKSNMTTILTTIYESNRCPHVNELLLNETIRGFPSRKKVKYYRRACEVSKSIKWFHDEAYLCFCDKDRRPDCLFFQQESTQCTTDYCQNNGRCVQNNFNGVWDFGCVCDGCAYGSLCQLTTSQYALSLDAMLGQDILENVSLTDQPVLIKLVLSVIVLMLLLGFVSNVLALITFKQPKVQEFGCGVYLFCLPLVGQLGLSIFAGRFFYLLGTQVYNVDNRSAALWSCVGLEYFLSVCPMLFDWLTACVAVERSVNIIKGVLFKKADSVWWAKRVILLLTVVILSSAWHEPLIRQLIDDPRATIRHTWCVVTFPWPWLEYYRLTINLINLIVPVLINLVATAFLLHKSTRMKQAFARKKSQKGYFTTFKKQVPLYGSPLGLVVLSLMRLIFSFTLVCIIHQWQKYVYLIAYFISFVPLMGTFPIFVLPAKIYKTEFNNFIQRMSRNWRVTRIR